MTTQTFVLISTKEVRVNEGRKIAFVHSYQSKSSMMALRLKKADWNTTKQ